MMQMQGKADTVLLYKEFPPFISWLKDNMNLASASGKSFYQRGRASCTEWDTGNNVLVSCEIDGLGHYWPGGHMDTHAQGPCEKLCQGDIDASAEMWRFFKRYQKGQSGNNGGGVDDNNGGGVDNNG